MTSKCETFYKTYKDHLNRSQRSKVSYKACCWDCNDFYIGKTKRRLHDRKTEHFKSLTKKSKNDHSSAVPYQLSISLPRDITLSGITEILASGKTHYHCKIKETLFIPSNIRSEKVMLYLAFAFCINYC